MHKRGAGLDRFEHLLLDVGHVVGEKVLLEVALRGETTVTHATLVRPLLRVAPKVDLRR